MRRMVSLLLAAIGGLSAGWAHATQPEHFLVRNTQDLVNLCTVGENEPLHEAAIHFCHGYVVGAYHFYQASTAGPKAKKLVCPPDPMPSRNEAIADLIRWAQQNPQYMDERAVDTMMRFLVMTWPCPKEGSTK